MQHLVALPTLPTRAQIERFEEFLRDVADRSGVVTIDASYEFADGLVARTIRIPFGTVLTGAAHKSEHLNLCNGDITVWTETGMRRLTGYHVITSRPGAKRVGLAHADTWWTTIHHNPTNERDPDELERLMIETPGQLQAHRSLTSETVGA